MKIEHKLELSNQFNYVCFIGTGLFCYVYNQSAFILTEQLNYQLKVIGKQIKKLQNQSIAVAGIPVSSIINHFPAAKKTSWGYSLQGDFKAQGYHAWMESIMAQAASDSHHVDQKTVNIETLPQDELENLAKRLRFTPKQIAYILKRYKQNQLTHTDLKFLEHLRSYILSSLP